jgi:hypothetical protein
MRNMIARSYALPPCRLLLAVAPLLLGACVNEPAAGSPLPPLARDREEPALALVEHVLTEHFAGQAAASDPPTTCVELKPTGLTAAQEEALIARFPRLAPRGRCETERPPPSDEFTGERAVLVQVYDFQCSDADHCTAWVSRPGSPAMRYTLTFESGAWSFAGDRRILAE